MTSTLHDQLGRLAERADDPSRQAVDRPSGRELWDRGVRYRRRVRGGTLAILGSALAALAVIVGVTVHRAAPPPEPQPAEAPAGLPSRIWAPSAWLPGTDETGPLGQAVAVFGATRRGWLGSEPGLVGVSAATGDYRFLDLPDRASGDVALAPDGRHLAYWTTGNPSGSPNSLMSGGDPVTGVAVYDLATGRVVRHDFRTVHGLSPDVLFWVDDDHAYVGLSQWAVGDDGDADYLGVARDGATWLWDISEAEPREWPDGQRAGIYSPGISANGRVAVVGRGGFWFFGSAPPVGVADRREAGSTLLNDTNVAVSPDGTRVAGIWDGGRTPNDVAVVPLGPYRPADYAGARLQDSDRSLGVEGWLDDEHLAVTRDLPRSRGGVGDGVYEMDAATGSSTPLVALPRQGIEDIQWASDLLSAPVVDRPEPPRPLDPRVVTGLGVAVLLAAGLGLWGWRRRVAP